MLKKTRIPYLLLTCLACEIHSLSLSLSLPLLPAVTPRPLSQRTTSMKLRWPGIQPQVLCQPHSDPRRFFTPPPLRCNLGVYPLARRTGTQTHRSLLFLQAHGCSQYSARTLGNRHRYMQVIRETVNAPGCVTSVFQPGTNLKTRRTA